MYGNVDIVLALFWHCFGIVSHGCLATAATSTRALLHVRPSRVRIDASFDARISEQDPTHTRCPAKGRWPPPKRSTGLGEVTDGAVPVRLPLFVNTLDVQLRGVSDHVFRPHAMMQFWDAAHANARKKSGLKPRPKDIPGNLYSSCGGVLGS